MEYDMDIEEFSCFQWNYMDIKEYDMDIGGVFLFLVEYVIGMDIEKFSCF